MVSTLTVVGLMFGLAYLQQQYLNRLIATDQEYLASLIAKRAPYHTFQQAEQSHLSHTPTLTVDPDKPSEKLASAEPNHWIARPGS